MREEGFRHLGVIINTTALKSTFTFVVSFVRSCSVYLCHRSCTTPVSSSRYPFPTATANYFIPCVALDRHLNVTPKVEHHKSDSYTTSLDRTPPVLHAAFDPRAHARQYSAAGFQSYSVASWTKANKKRLDKRANMCGMMLRLL